MLWCITINRLNSDIAIQNFVRYIEYQSGDFLSKRYEKFFDGKFREISYRFLDKITDVKWDGYWEEYQILEPKWIAILKYKVYPRLLRLLQGTGIILQDMCRVSRCIFLLPDGNIFIVVSGNT